MTRERWTIDRIPDQSGRIAVVTGAASGVGLATARALAMRGGEVILAVRDMERGRRAAAAITAAAPHARLDVRPLDLADLDSVRSFAAELRERRSRLDLLVNNAGIMAPPRSLSPQGHELQFATNHLGHFALTGLLLDRLAADGNSRVVTVSSPNHRQGRIAFDDLDGERAYSPMGHYNQSKLANAAFGLHLHRLLARADSPVRSVLAHPGYVATNLQKETPVGMVRLLYGRLLAPLAQKPADGALPILYAATEPTVKGGEFIAPGGTGELRGAPTRVAAAERASDEATGRRLWDVSEELTGVGFTLPTAV
ncbi:SDR family NAD(P)-dependent oxidoreductase [Streptomyces sp. SID8379]|uniref:oxidoreductase n=1 Tax=unclassified Streptomyces TaxID=2593676 RepID=UPI00036D08C9|nr:MULTISPECIES: oxidoreductase [unclassified Streptomyces]MYW64389.1 SDR family NAD(P)-dependent oxidoreductase [Streptomyces sp. SID8379]